ncbi:MAG: ATP synthase F0 subunit C [Oligoflexia bacterium]|nr:ATP synthase F0 subunit C [Oligoflexia bacterium]
MKKIIYLLLSVISLLVLAAVAWASTSAGGDAGAVATAAAASAGSILSDKAVLGLGGVLGVGIAAAGGGIGQGLIGSRAMEGISRNPSALDKIFTPMILTIAFVESLVIFTIVSIFLVR